MSYHKSSTLPSQNHNSGTHNYGGNTCSPDISNNTKHCCTPDSYSSMYYTSSMNYPRVYIPPHKSGKDHYSSTPSKTVDTANTLSSQHHSSTHSHTAYNYYHPHNPHNSSYMHHTYIKHSNRNQHRRSCMKSMSSTPYNFEWYTSTRSHQWPGSTVEPKMDK